MDLQSRGAGLLHASAKVQVSAFVEDAGSWFLHSGIQEYSGGVARYYRSDEQRNQPVSTEITGYFASVLLYSTG